jgi:hypothetical protein
MDVVAVGRLDLFAPLEAKQLEGVRKHRFGRGHPLSQRSAQKRSTCTPTFRFTPQSSPRPRAAKLERAAAATGTDVEQKLQNNQTVPDAAWVSP